MADNNQDRDDINTVHTEDQKEPATAHDVGIGGGLGVVGGAVVGALAGGPIGAVIGAIAGGVASAGAVDVVDKRDHDYARTAHTDTAATTAAPVGTTTDYSTNTTGYAAPVASTPVDDNYATTAVGTNTLGTDANQRIQLREEELSASKREVQAGEVTLHKEIITETRSIDVPVTREEVVIERHPVSGTAAPNADFNTADQVIRVPVMEEQVTLEKTPVVTEEVSVGRREVTETQHLTGTVRHEELRVDDPTGVRSGTALEDELDEDELDSDVNTGRLAR